MKNLRLKFLTKTTFLWIFAAISVGTLVTSCSKDKDPYDYSVPEEKIDGAVGTYKGRMEIRNNSDLDISGKTYYDAVVTVSKVDNSHLKVTAKAGEEYSVVTEKVFQVEGYYGGDVYDLSGNVSGSFHYSAETKGLSLYTEDQAATDITYFFEGTKQYHLT